ncbi:putative serine/threonine protein kinase KIN4 [Saccharomyces paradoxus]|uniref:non-specific serine/threonine protein kinase n=1 Tax=Saccharomyces paradoxus TaxID=27291 RepID=A0A8B8V062_SACPA|nr:Kin4 [Saccharomyces paradoxus]QHS76326.1 Kin4 [Saccharomyces paradoxus]
MASVPKRHTYGGNVVTDRNRHSLQRNNEILHPIRKDQRKHATFGPYIIGSTLGEGEFGKVKLGWTKPSSSNEVPKQVAIKLIRRDTIKKDADKEIKIYREINALKHLTHPNIIYLEEVLQNSKYIGIVLEFVSGGEFYKYIQRKRRLKESSACRLFAQLISGVNYMHYKGLVHRDLKLENLLLDKHENLVITDFGFVNEFFEDNELMKTSCGSPCYAAPELVVSTKAYEARKADVWSCGIILYAMLAGYLPWDDDHENPTGDDIARLYKYITQTPLKFPEYITPIPRDLLRRILVPNPRRRVSLQAIERHVWLKPHEAFLSIQPNYWDEHLQRERPQLSNKGDVGRHSTYSSPASSYSKSRDRNSLIIESTLEQSRMSPQPLASGSTSPKSSSDPRVVLNAAKKNMKESSITSERTSAPSKYTRDSKDNSQIEQIAARHSSRGNKHTSVAGLVTIPGSPTTARTRNSPSEPTEHLKGPSPPNFTQEEFHRVGNYHVPRSRPRPTSYYPGLSRNTPDNLVDIPVNKLGSSGRLADTKNIVVPLHSLEGKPSDIIHDATKATISNNSIILLSEGPAAKTSPVDYHYAIGDLNHGDKPITEAIVKMNKDLTHKIVEHSFSQENVELEGTSMISVTKESNDSTDEERVDTQPENVGHSSNKSDASSDKENKKNYERKRFSFMSLYSSLNGSRSTVGSRNSKGNAPPISSRNPSGQSNKNTIKITQQQPRNLSDSSMLRVSNPDKKISDNRKRNNTSGYVGNENPGRSVRASVMVSTLREEDRSGWSNEGNNVEAQTSTARKVLNFFKRRSMRV